MKDKIKSSDYASEYPDFKTQLSLPFLQEQDIELVFSGEERKTIIEFLLNNGNVIKDGYIKRGNFIGNAIVLCASALGLVEKCVFENYDGETAKDTINKELDDYFKMIRKYVFWYLEKIEEHKSGEEIPF